MACLGFKVSNLHMQKDYDTGLAGVQLASGVKFNNLVNILGLDRPKKLKFQIR